MKRNIIPLLLLTAATAFGQIRQPFEWTHRFEGDQLTVEASIPEGAYLYAERTSVDAGDQAVLLESPVAHPHIDDFGTADIYEGGQIHRWVYQTSSEAVVTVRYQGCGTPDGGSAVCYPPDTKTFTATGNETAIGLPNIGNWTPADGSLENLLDRFEVVRTDGGVKNPEEFLAFLDTGSESKASASILEGKSVWIMILLVLLGGLALNLTPCVLPMIPVNLAIIGAGSGAATKRQGFLRGGVYGLGIALAYGSLGLFTVLTGSKFGTLNSSPIFNFIIAAVFIVLALALFDRLNIDLSRYGSKFGISSEKRGRLIPAFVMGAVAALLAGACVAPIVIAVLLQATTLYASGHVAGLFLPLLLGIGMALPWPIAGAGLTVLPKPGMWMIKVKHTFGILILLFAGYYAWLGIGLLPKASNAKHSTESALESLEMELNDALISGKPVFIDFWAHWCKNCLQMEKTTFKDPAVKERLKDFQVIKFQAEDIGDPRIKALLDRYNLPGLPGYVILGAKN